MELLDVGFAEVTTAVAQVSEIARPPYQTALSLLEQCIQNEYFSGHLPIRLKGLDEVLCGGIPFGVLTELVVFDHDKAIISIILDWFCMKLSLLASLPTNFGGLEGHVIYVDVESKLSSRRYLGHAFLISLNMAGRILVLQPSSLAEFTKSLQQIKVSLLQHQVKLLVIDSMTTLVSGRAIRLLGHHASRCVIGGTKIEDYAPRSLCNDGEANRKPAAKTGQQPSGALYSVLGPVANRGKSGTSQWISRQGDLSMHASLSFGTELRQSILCNLEFQILHFRSSVESEHPAFGNLRLLAGYDLEPIGPGLGRDIGSLAKFSRIPVVVTNQVRSQSSDEISQYAFQLRSRDDTIEESARFDSHLIPSLGIHWSHAVTIRLVLEAKSGILYWGDFGNSQIVTVKTLTAGN
ncbi:hypothetical protein HYC85_006946 [Camellia sinensis]|uniref:Rad51-like C-terminal domain-containing protein n=1 Tax=Camellia sinensis TaxID=4442 RepID=A0A7J7HML8_CAMSI|nr:hypothetical protein HYC85_006946 [Camellia sinensis]